MAAPPLPSAGTSSPPLNKFPFTVPSTGMLTLLAVSFLTQLWAAVLGDGGIGPTVAQLASEVSTLMGQVALLQMDVANLVTQVTIIFNMHGDGSLSGAGALTVTKTNGVAFDYFATGTDASNLTGTLAPARIAANSLPYAKLANTTGPALLGRQGAGAVQQITLGRGVVFSGATLVAQDPITTVGALGAATAGQRAFVSDSTVVAAGNFGAIVAGGGGDFVPVWADGANWLIG